MCMEDVRLGRETTFQANSISLANATNSVIANYDPYRTALILMVTGATAALIGPKPLSPAGGEGAHLGQGEGALSLDVLHHGNLVTQEWRASGDGGATKIVVWQSRLEKD